MCLAVPSKVIRLDDLTATVDVYGARKDVSLMLMPEPVALGEYVLVHAGFAIQKVDEEAALDALNLIREMAELLDAEDAASGAACGSYEDDFKDAKPLPSLDGLGLDDKKG